MKKLIDICEFIVDCPHSTANDEGEGYPLIRTPNIGQGRFILEGVHRVSQEVYEKRNARAIPRSGDLILAREAPAGNVAIIKNNQKFCLGQRTVLIRPDIRKVNPDYLVYYLLAPLQQNNLKSSANGSTVAHVNMPVIRNLKVDLPELIIQNRIASILSAYDDLIENNQKQIKLLEEAAQRLYKEWFVDLRFPGHENVKIVDGVPEGWEKIIIGNYVTIKSGYAFKSSSWTTSGNPVVKIKDIKNNMVDISALDYVDSTITEKLEEYRLNEGDLVIAMTGATIGKVGLVPKIKNLYTNQRVGKMFPKKCLVHPTPFLFCFYSSALVQDKILALSSSSSAQPNISGKQLESFPLMSNLVIVNKFNEILSDSFLIINDLRNQVYLLQEVRDRLLPKLMSGEIEV